MPELVQMIALVFERCVIASKDGLKEARKGLLVRRAGQGGDALTQKIMSLRKGGLDGTDIAGATRDIILWIVGVDD